MYGNYDYFTEEQLEVLDWQSRLLTGWAFDELHDDDREWVIEYVEAHGMLECV